MTLDEIVAELAVGEFCAREWEGGENAVVCWKKHSNGDLSKWYWLRKLAMWVPSIDKMTPGQRNAKDWVRVPPREVKHQVTGY